MIMMIVVLPPPLCTKQAKWAERFPKVMRRSERRNNLQICPRRDLNTCGSDLWSSTLPLDHGGAISKIDETNALQALKLSLSNTHIKTHTHACGNPHTYTLTHTHTQGVIYRHYYFLRNNNNNNNNIIIIIIIIILIIIMKVDASYSVISVGNVPMC